MELKTYDELFGKFIGQTELKNMLYDMYVCSIKQNKLFPHTLFIASAGQGKTELSKIMAKALCDKPMKIFAPAITSWADMMVMLKKVSPERNVVFIDEVHALPKDVQEMLYTVMTNFTSFDRKTGTYTKFAPFTIFAATTDPQYMLRPFFDRFVNTMVFTKYTEKDMRDLFGSIYKEEKFDSDVITKFVALSHHTPRKFHALKTRLGYYIDAHGLDENRMVGSEYFEKFLLHIGLDSRGFNALQRQYLEVLKALNSPASLTTLANLLELKQEVITRLVEPDLIAAGCVTISSSGRMYKEAQDAWD